LSVWRGCQIPDDRSYDIEGDLWVKFEGDVVRLGLTDIAQTRMGRLVSIRFKPPGRWVKAGGSVATMESAKWVGPVHTPFAGEIVEVNEGAYVQDILIANRDPYGAAWVARLRPDDPAAPDRPLLSGDQAYAAYRERIELLGVTCMRCED
jgi:glycine cleavage system H protein